MFWRQNEAPNLGLSLSYYSILEMGLCMKWKGDEKYEYCSFRTVLYLTRCGGGSGFSQVSLFVNELQVHLQSLLFLLKLVDVLRHLGLISLHKDSHLCYIKEANIALQALQYRWMRAVLTWSEFICANKSAMRGVWSVKHILPTGLEVLCSCSLVRLEKIYPNHRTTTPHLEDFMISIC